ncbi:MAG: hypothetical protein JST19_16315 [Bacteroidetes bacterium]|nr:hypothetical protein [Bacteroidota bacterium]
MKLVKKISKSLFPAALLLIAALLQNCKKEAVHKSAAPPNEGMYALVNDTAWTAVTVTASLEYNQISTGKTFTCQGTMGNKIIQLMATQNNVPAGNSFPVGPADPSSDSFGYLIMPIHRNLTEQNNTPGTTPGTSLVITSIDTAKRLISGTFSFPQADTAYDAFDNVTAVTTNQVTNGFFKKIHYVYTP